MRLLLADVFLFSVSEIPGSLHLQVFLQPETALSISFAKAQSRLFFIQPAAIKINIDPGGWGILVDKSLHGIIHL
ncbi:hypothetical protein DVZ67_25020 [Salmonella enterica subsp. enterica serovar Saintpaul]|nr:hypothetical protein [Salmonella enterica]ECC9158994.1 hypothetical protein [Salmonella enterica subsp. salamae]ECT1737386.1 hypothetical protein [Salmonella enterica subsp. enterica serovar Saintpaul]